MMSGMGIKSCLTVKTKITAAIDTEQLEKVIQ
jgi:hypothetical protein